MHAETLRLVPIVEFEAIPELWRIYVCCCLYCCSIRHNSLNRIHTQLHDVQLHHQLRKGHTCIDMIALCSVATAVPRRSPNLHSAARTAVPAPETCMPLPVLINSQSCRSRACMTLMHIYTRPGSFHTCFIEQLSSAQLTGTTLAKQRYKKIHTNI